MGLTVNILTNHAIDFGKITVFRGGQRRPSIHIEDIIDLYVDFLASSKELVVAKTWNSGYENHHVWENARIVSQIVDKKGVEISMTPAEDHRSYHVFSDKITWDLSFVTKHTIEDAIQDLVNAFH